MPQPKPRTLVASDMQTGVGNAFTPPPKQPMVPPPKTKLEPVLEAEARGAGVVPTPRLTPPPKSRPTPPVSHVHDAPEGRSARDQVMDSPAETTPEAMPVMSPYEVQRRQMAYLLATCLVLGIATMIAVPALLITVASKPPPRIVAVTPDLRVMQLPSLSEPYISDSAVSDWATQTVINTVSLGFDYWQEQLSAVEDDYTPGAFKQVVASLKNSNILPTMIAKRFDITAVPLSPPVIVASGVFKGTYTWKVTFPLSLTLEDSDGVETPKPYNVTVIVQRVSVAYNPRGVAVEQITFGPAQNN